MLNFCAVSERMREHEDGNRCADYVDGCYEPTGHSTVTQCVNYERRRSANVSPNKSLQRSGDP